MNTVISGLQIGIIFQSMVFLAFLWFDNRLTSMVNRLAFVQLVILSVHMLFNLLQSAGLDWPVLNLIQGFGLFYGPLITLYANTMMFKTPRWQMRGLWHFLPGMLVCLLAVWQPLPVVLIATLTFLSLVVYLAWALFNYGRFRSVVKQTQSNNEQVVMRWMGALLVLNVVIVAMNIGSFGLSVVLANSALAKLSEIGLFLLLLILVNAYILKGLTQPRLFSGVSQEDEIIANQTASSQSMLDAALVRDLQDRLPRHMAKAKPHHNPMLNLRTLARQIGVPPRQLSGFINQKLGMSFSDYVNEQRLADVKLALSNAADSRSLLAIGFECGFSTKSNFNRVFKKHVGMTPSVYRKQHFGVQA